MNRFTWLLLITTFLPIAAAPECMDNSWHLQKPFDHKNYHLVQCNCPCQKRYTILADRGLCIKCRHFRDPRPFITISAQNLPAYEPEEASDSNNPFAHLYRSLD